MQDYTVILQKMYTLRLTVEAESEDDAIDTAISVSDEIAFSDWHEDSFAEIDPHQ